jgi:hypothetical protein
VPASSPARTIPDPDAPAPDPRPTREVWYGWQTLLADAVSLTIAIGAGLQESYSLGFVSYGSYCLLPSAVHWAHGNVGTGFADLGMRGVGPIATFLLGGGLSLAASANKDGHEAFYLGGLVGWGLGYIATVIVDAAVFAYDKPQKPAESGQTSWLHRRGIRAAPTVRLGMDAASVGLGGTF